MVFLNLRAGEKQIRHILAHELAVEHPQFLRSMGNLLGAGLLPGNRAPALHNGARIFALRASRVLRSALLDAGVEIHEFQPTMYHCKVLIVDDVWVSVGSTNFDDRSFRLNDETNLNSHDAVFAREQVQVFEDDKRKSRAITRTELRDRSASGETLDAIASTIRRQL